MLRVLQSCPTLCKPMDCSQPGSSVHGIFQARIREWVAVSSSRGSSRPRDQTWVSKVSCTIRWALSHCVTQWSSNQGAAHLSHLIYIYKSLLLTYFQQSIASGRKKKKTHDVLEGQIGVGTGPSGSELLILEPFNHFSVFSCPPYPSHLSLFWYLVLLVFKPFSDPGGVNWVDSSLCRHLGLTCSLC